MDNHSNVSNLSGRTGSQSRYALIALLLFSSAKSYAQLDIVYTIIDGEKVVEFGDRGNAPNQYKLKVGDLNTISSTIVTQY